MVLPCELIRDVSEVPQTRTLSPLLIVTRWQESIAENTAHLHGMIERNLTETFLTSSSQLTSFILLYGAIHAARAKKTLFRLSVLRSIFTKLVEEMRLLLDV